MRNEITERHPMVTATAISLELRGPEDLDKSLARIELKRLGDGSGYFISPRGPFQTDNRYS
jgi:hypothetical protein